MPNEPVILPVTSTLRAEAEALARDFHAVLRAQAGARQEEIPAWEATSVDFRHVGTTTHLWLLRDLSRPASMDAAARRLARRVGLAVGATAPGWDYMPADPPNSVASWALWNDHGPDWCCLDYPPDIEDSLGPPPPWGRGQPARVRGLPTDPATALAAALAATEPESP